MLRSLSVALLTLLVAGALKLTSAVTMPLFFAVFLVSLASPLQGALAKHLPSWAANLLTFLATLAVLTGVFVSLYFCLRMLADGAPHYQDLVSNEAARIDHALGGLGVNTGLSRGGQLKQLAGSLGKGAAALAQRVAAAGGGLILVLTFTMLALPEVERWRSKFCLHYGEELFSTASAISARFRSYVGVRTLTSTIMGLATGLFTWLMGVDFAFVWGVSSFFLNFVPTLGGIAAIILPSLLAFLQLGVLGGLGVLTVLILIHIGIGSFLDPLLQGRSMQLSPLVVLFSIAWWGFLWGIGGALLAVPLTVTVVSFCAQFPRSAWLADLLSDEPVPRRAKRSARKDAPLSPKSSGQPSESPERTGPLPRSR